MGTKLIGEIANAMTDSAITTAVTIHAVALMTVRTCDAICAWGAVSIVGAVAAVGT